ncbi:MAG: metal ABC transporter substrate-binding protein [Cellulomonadaceae bacterium]
MFPSHTRGCAALALLLVATLTACGAPSGSADAADDARVQVQASFYPLQYVAEQVGGAHVQVTNMTPAAADPHSLELSPAQIREIGTADVVLYLSDFQAAVDQAVTTVEPGAALDVAEAARMERSPNGPGVPAAEGAVLDPHFWLDATRLADVGTEVAERFAQVDPEHAEEYRANAERLVGELVALDQDFRNGLAPCAAATLVVSHEAFGYLAQRFDLVQVGISGINPEAEPSPARLREVRAVVEEAGVRTVFFEVLTSPKVTQTLADDLGVDVAKLDPIEGHTDADADYQDVMRANLTALENGLACAS